MPTGEIRIRPAEANDMEALTDLLQTLFALEADFAPDPERQRRGLACFLEGCGRYRCLLVALAAKRVVGMVSLQTLVSTAEGGPVGLLEDLVVAPDWRGRGVGRRLLDAIGEWAARRGLLRLQLLADRDNGAALGFYRAAGWGTTRLICLRRRADLS